MFIGESWCVGCRGSYKDHSGDMVLGFSFPLGQCTNNHAEAMGLYHGVRFARNMGFEAIEIEMDLKLLTGWISNKRCSFWYLEDFWEEVMSSLDEIQFTCNHIYRECNPAADSLAKLDAQGSTLSVYSVSDLPREMRGIIRLDKSGLPYIKKL